MKLKKSILITSLAILGSVQASAALANPYEACDHQFYDKTPPLVSEGLPGERFALCFDGFAVMYSGESKTAIFSAEYLNADMLKKTKDIKRTNKFYAEARLPSEYRSQLSDYAKSGYDRGHLYPAGNASTKEAMAQSFSLANMVPQDPTHNRGPWAKSVEKATRSYVERTDGAVYIVTGPIYGPNPKTIGDSEVWVPTSMYKFIYDPINNKAWGYLLDNNSESKVEGVYAYEDMVNATGINFLPTLSN